MIRWTMERLPSGAYAGMITMVPTQGTANFRKGQPIKLVAKSSTKAGALAKAAAVANKLASNPLLAAALPPGSTTAIKAIDFLSKSAAAGKLESAAKKVTGKGAKRLYKALSSFF